MQIQIRDFSGEIQWLALGDRLLVDKSHIGLSDLIRISKNEVVELSSLFQNSIVDEKKQFPILKALMEKFSYKYEQLYISNAQGHYFNAAGQRNYIHDREYFQKVMHGHTITSGPIINRSTGRLVIASATPIFNNNVVEGLFGVTIAIESEYKGVRYLFPAKGRHNQNFRRRNSHIQKTKGLLSVCQIA